MRAAIVGEIQKGMTKGIPAHHAGGQQRENKKPGEGNCQAYDGHRLFMSRSLTPSLHLVIARVSQATEAASRVWRAVIREALGAV